MIDINKVIVLENKEEYLILDKVTNDNIDYYYIAKVNETKTDIENNYKLVIIKEIGTNRIVEEVTGEEKLRKILPLFSSEL